MCKYELLDGLMGSLVSWEIRSVRRQWGQLPAFSIIKVREDGNPWLLIRCYPAPFLIGLIWVHFTEKKPISPSDFVYKRVSTGKFHWQLLPWRLCPACCSTKFPALNKSYLIKELFYEIRTETILTLIALTTFTLVCLHREMNPSFPMYTHNN